MNQDVSWLCKLTHTWERAEIFNTCFMVEIKQVLTRLHFMLWAKIHTLTLAGETCASLGGTLQSHSWAPRLTSLLLSTSLCQRSTNSEAGQHPFWGRIAALRLSTYREVKQHYIGWCNVYIFTSVTTHIVWRPKLLLRCRFKWTQSKNKLKNKNQSLLYNSNSCEETNLWMQN